MSAGTYEIYERLLTVNPEIRVHVLLHFAFLKQSLFQHPMLTTSNHGYKAILKVYKHFYIVEPYFQHHSSWLFSLIHLLAAAVLGQQLVIICLEHALPTCLGRVCIHSSLFCSWPFSLEKYFALLT